MTAWHPEWSREGHEQLELDDPRVAKALQSIERQRLRRKDDALMGRVLAMQATILLAVLADILLQITGAVD